MDLLQLIDDGWFGKRAEQQLKEPEEQGPQLRRGSAGSLSDAAAANEQDDAAEAAPRRDPHRRQPSNSQPAAAVRLPRPLLNGRRSRDEEQEEDGVLGTWAGRQKIFSEHLRQQEQDARPAAAQQQQQRQQQQPQPQPQQDWGSNMWPRPESRHEVASTATPAVAAGSSWREPQRGETPVVLAPPPLAGPGTRGQAAAAAVTGGGGSSLDEEVHAAWRWRFTRKWQAEQLAALEAPAAPQGGGEDEEEWAAALRLMGAVEGGLNMQIGRTLSLHTSSMDPGGSMGCDASLTLMSPGLSQLLLDGSVKESPLREDAATAHIVSVARKAQVLRQQQQEIERQVSERWEAATGGGPWVAQHLPAVQIDSWSAFPFVLARLSEQRSQRQKLLVRGRNGASEQQAYAAVEQEAARMAVAHRLPGPRCELAASGRMEWVAPAAPGQRRTLVVRVTRLLPPAAKDARLLSAAAASEVVAQLARASFPAADFEVVPGDAPSAPAAAAAATKSAPLAAPGPNRPGL